MDWPAAGSPMRWTQASESLIYIFIYLLCDFCRANSNLLIWWLMNDLLDSHRYTYEVGPVFVLMENEIIQMFCKSFGFVNGDGIFSPGGSMSNMYGMVLARFNAVPNIKTKGCFNLKPLVVFTSEEVRCCCPMCFLLSNGQTDRLTFIWLNRTVALQHKKSSPLAGHRHGESDRCEDRRPWPDDRQRAGEADQHGVERGSDAIFCERNGRFDSPGRLWQFGRNCWYLREI